MNKEEIEAVLNELMYQGIIVGYEIPLTEIPLRVKILVSSSTPELQRRLKEALPGVSLEIEETGPIEAQ